MSDIIQKLAPETLSQIFFYLSYRQLIRTTLSSKAWRSEIMSNPTLHRTLDLKWVRWGTTEMDVIKLVHDIASRSPHVFKELHLDLSCFWTQLANAYRVERLISPFTFDQAMAATSSRYSSLITIIYLATKGQLEKLFIEISPDRICRIQTSLSQVFTQGTAELSHLMPSLREVHFKIPFPFSMSLGEEGKGQDCKRFSIVNNDYLIEEQEEEFAETFAENDGLQCLGFLQKAKDFTGKSFNSFSIKSESLVGWERNSSIAAQFADFKKFLQEVKISALSLTSLELDFDEDLVPDTALDLVVNCPSLSSLNFTLRSSALEVKQIGFPPQALPSTIKSLELYLAGVNLDWDSQSLLSWFGKHLEFFHLSILNSDSDPEIEVPLQSMLSILNRNPMIEALTLVSVSIVETTIIPSELSLPNLGYLELSSLPRSGNGLFDNLSAAKLHDLDIELAERIEEETDEGNEAGGFEVDSTFENFVSLLESCHSSLKDLSIRESAMNEHQMSSNKPPSALVFPYLESIRMSPSSSRLDELLSTCHFPKIQELLNRSDYSESPSVGFTAQLLTNSSSTIKVIELFNSQTSSLREASKLSSQADIKSPFFSKLEAIELSTSGLDFLPFFSQAKYERLKSLRLELRDEGTEASRSQEDDVVSLVLANASSLASIILKISGYDGSFESQYNKRDAPVLQEIKRNPIEIPELTWLYIGRRTLALQVLQVCQTPKLQKVRLDCDVWRSTRDLSLEEFKSYDEDIELRKVKENFEMEQLEKERLKAAKTEMEELMLEEEGVDEVGSQETDESEVERQEDEAERALKRRMDWI